MTALAVAIVLLIATAVLWWVLDVTGVFRSITQSVNDVVGSGSVSFDIAGALSFDRVMGISLVMAAMEVVLVAALATLFAFLYNLSVGITGGLEVTLSEES